MVFFDTMEVMHAWPNDPFFQFELLTPFSGSREDERRGGVGKKRRREEEKKYTCTKPKGSCSALGCVR
jgi:hypothetical protein